MRVYLFPRSKIFDDFGDKCSNRTVNIYVALVVFYRKSKTVTILGNMDRDRQYDIMAVLEVYNFKLSKT